MQCSAQTPANIRPEATHVRARRRVAAATVTVLLRFLPLGAAAVLVVPLPWVLPRILALQALVPAAYLEGAPAPLYTIPVPPVCAGMSCV